MEIMTSQNQVLDIAIVGGGIAGLYCLYRLLRDQERAAQKIKLYESCDHLGGRIETWSLKRVRDDGAQLGYEVAHDPRHVLAQDKHDKTDPYEDPEKSEYFRAEFGPMRIEPRDQPLLKALLDDLGIKEPEPGGNESLDDLVPFFSYTSEDPQSPKFTLKGEEGEQATPLDLLLLGIRRILEIIDNPRQYNKDHINWSNEKVQNAWDNLHIDKSYHRQYWKAHLIEWINQLQDSVEATDGQTSDYQVIREHFKINKHPLWDLGFWNALSDVLSHYAVVKIRDWGTYYHFLHENLNAAEWMIFWLKAIKGTSSLRGIRGGMSRIIYATMFQLAKLNRESTLSPNETAWSYKQFNKKRYTQRGTFLRNGLGNLIEIRHELLGLSLNQNDGYLDLKIKKKKAKGNGEEVITVTAKHVILALPKYPLEQLNLPDVFKLYGLGENQARIEKALMSVKCLPLLKCFFILENPWWEDDRHLNRFASDLPTRELSYHKSKDKTKGIIMVYTDHPSIAFWSDYLRKSGEPASGTQDHYTFWFKTDSSPDKVRLWNRFVQFARDYEHHDFSPDRLLACSIRDWGKKPFRAAAHGWLPGERSWEHIEYLAAFPTSVDATIKAHLKGRIHVCGEAYSDYQGFIEGSLRSALKTINKLPKNI